MRSATVASPTAASGARLVRASNQGITFSRKSKSGKVCDEACFVFEATQVKDQCLILDAADYRNGKLPQRRDETHQGSTRCARIRGLDRKAGARDGLGRESTGTNLA